MATKEFFEFEDKAQVADIEGVKTFEMLVAKTGNDGINVTLASLKTWLLMGDVGLGSQYDIKTAVDTLKTALATSILTLDGKTLTSAADRITANTDLYVNVNKVAQEGTSPAFLDPTVQTIGDATGNGKIAFAADVCEVSLSGVPALSITRGGGVNTISVLSGNLSLGTGDMTTAGASRASQYVFTGTDSRIHRTVGEVHIQPTAGAAEFVIADGEARLEGDGAGASIIATVANSTVGDSGFDVRAEATKSIGGGFYVRRKTVGAGDYSASVIKSWGTEINFTMPAYEAGGAWPGDPNTEGRMTVTAPEGVELSAGTSLTVDPGDLIVWRTATPSLSGLMSAAQAAEVAKIAAIEVANGDLTQSLGFQTLNDGTNSRTATEGDRILNIASGNGDLTVVVNPTGGTTELTITVTDQMVKLGAAQPLTNKTILAATNVIEATKLQTTEIDTTAPTDDQILKYDAGSGKWRAEDPAAQAVDPVYTKGTLGAPSFSFQGDLGSTSGIYHKMTAPYLSALDGVAIVQNGIRSALFGEAGVHIDQSLLVGNHTWVGVNRTTDKTSDIVFRRGAGIRGNSQRKSITIRANSKDVAEFDQDKTSLLSGLSLKVHNTTADLQLTVSDSVVMCSGNAKLMTLPDARFSLGQLLIIGASAGSSTSSGGAAASTVDVQGFSTDGGTTRDAVDGKADGIKISANESAMLICDGKKWMRVGGSPGASAPVTEAAFTKLMINFGHNEGFGDNPTGSGLIYPVMNVTFPKADSVSAQTTVRPLHDSGTGELADVYYEYHKGQEQMPVAITFGNQNFTLKESQECLYNQSNLAYLSESDTWVASYFTLNDLPAGTYNIMINGGYPPSGYYGVRLVIAEETPITPGANDIIYSDALANPVGSYIKRDRVTVLGDTGPCVLPNMAASPNQQVGKGLAHTTFTVGAKQNVRFYWVQGVRNPTGPYGLLHAVYLVKTA
jgi:hypothetical protein